MSDTASPTHSRIKKNGVHYTPPELAAFLARSTFTHVAPITDSITVLDPACGGGALLASFVQAVPAADREHVNLLGYEQDPHAAEQSRETLANLGVRSVEIRVGDFLAFDGQAAHAQPPDPMVDVVIANPPYVRTQVLGATEAQRVGKQFGLSGRVDLYHAFSIAMSHRLRPGGVLGLLTSNRFLTIKSGIQLRKFLRREFAIESVVDLGDTKLFTAAVLPVVVVGKKGAPSNRHTECRFARVYKHRCDSDVAPTQFAHVLDAVDSRGFSGLAETEEGTYRIETGSLALRGDDEVWSLSTPESADWLRTVRANTRCLFADVAQVRVGIKTTADAVFIRDDWHTLSATTRPESSLLHPLITHHGAARWVAADGPPRKAVLYPHEMRGGKRAPIDLQKHPAAAAYLELHGDRLRSRKYLRDSGRAWYEIWVPHHPQHWAKPKIVFPDISEQPTFFLDDSGAIVNGDCYWITLKPGVDDDWLYLILAVANSSFIINFYDVNFHNKLYAGRRRFMTQYVKQFPLPELGGRVAAEIVRVVKKLIRSEHLDTRQRLARQANTLVSESFGLSQPCGKRDC